MASAGLAAPGKHVILFAGGLGKPIQRISAFGGEPQNVIEADVVSAPMAPFFLPDGRRFIYAAFRGPESVDIYLASLDDTAPTLLAVADAPAVYASGYLLYVRLGALMAHPFDAARGVLTGEAFSISQSSIDRYVAFSASNTGTLVYGRGSTLNRLVWADRDGKQTAVAAPASDYGTWELSRDDRRGAFDRISAGGMDVWTFDIQRQITSRLTTQALNNVPIWSPDGNAIAFATSRGRIGLDLYRRASTGAGDDELLLKADAPPRALFDTPLQQEVLRQTYAVSADGTRFLLQPPAETTASALTVVFDWPALIKP